MRQSDVAFCGNACGVRVTFTPITVSGAARGEACVPVLRVCMDRKCRCSPMRTGRRYAARCRERRDATMPAACARRRWQVVRYAIRGAMRVALGCAQPGARVKRSIRGGAAGNVKVM